MALDPVVCLEAIEDGNPHGARIAGVLPTFASKL